MWKIGYAETLAIGFFFQEFHFLFRRFTFPYYFCLIIDKRLFLSRNLYLLIAFGSLQYSFAFFGSSKCDDRTFINLYSFGSVCGIVKFTFGCIEVDFHINPGSLFHFGCSHLKLCNEKARCFLVVDGWGIIVLGEIPGCRSFPVEMEKTKLVWFEYREHSQVACLGRITFANLVYVSLAVFPMSQRISLEIKGGVSWNFKQVAFFHPGSFG